MTAGPLLALVLAAGCVTVEAPLRDTRGSPSLAIEACAQWFKQLDDTIDRAGARDAGAYRVPGFPYLRVDRFAASFRDEIKDNEPAFNAWVGLLKTLDADARDYELQNLPRGSFPILDATDKAAAKTETAACAARLASEDLASATQRSLLLARAEVPDNYSSWKRALGLYPITSIPFMQGVERWHAESTAMFQAARADTATARNSIMYEPFASGASAARIAEIFSRLKTDALGVPQLGAEDRATLFAAYAPLYEIETTRPHDRFGPLFWLGNIAPDVDVTRPVAYTRLAYTRDHGRTLVQFVYTIWFPERPASGAVDILAGKLDGVVFRVTIGADGAPLVYDTMHPCGCYHMFFPTARVQALPAPEPGIEWAFVPITLPAMTAAQRIVVRIASRTHYIVDVRPGAGVEVATPYRFADDNELRAIPVGNGVTRSAFGPDGIVAGTERGERFLFWPMGIDNSGAMRQWGRHATAFIGRRHFDDADLIERRFDISAGSPAALAPPR